MSSETASTSLATPPGASMGTPPATPPVLDVCELRKSYGSAERPAVDDISFSVFPGQVVGLLGPNGAGKTTTLSMVMGLLQPDRGRVLVDGLDMAGNRQKALERLNFAAVYSPLPGNLTVEQNLRVFGMLYSVKNLKHRMNELIRDFDLERFRNTRCGVLSSGEQTRASLAKAMLNRPRLLLLDEPTASLDPSVSLDIRIAIRNYAAQEQAGVLWTSHNMQEVEAVCSHVMLLSAGRVVLAGNPQTLPGEHGCGNLEELFIRVAREPLNPASPADSREGRV